MGVPKEILEKLDLSLYLKDRSCIDRTPRLITEDGRIRIVGLIVIIYMEDRPTPYAKEAKTTKDVQRITVYIFAWFVQTV